MITADMLNTLSELRREMAIQGRDTEEAALHEALRALAKPERGFLSTGQAAERLGVSLPTVRRWIERGVLVGGSTGGRWVVSTESVDRLLRVRRTLLQLDEEDNASSGRSAVQHRD
jgi:excisionase family DNA binding protein